MQMNWKREAEERLRSYNARKRAMTSIPQQIQALRLIREGIGAVRMDGTAVVGGGNGREEMLVSSLAREEELNRRLELNRLWVDTVETALGALTEEEQTILDRFFIHPQRYAVESLCGELCLERATVYRRKDQALRRFVMAMYGWEESL